MAPANQLVFATFMGSLFFAFRTEVQAVSTVPLRVPKAQIILHRGSSDSAQFGSKAAQQASYRHVRRFSRRVDHTNSRGI